MEIVQATLFQTFPFHSSAVSSITKSCQSTGKPSALPLISISAEKNEEHFQNQLYNRRNLLSNALVALLGGFTLSAGHCRPAQAFSLGISGPKEWLKEQKKKTADFLLAPIAASHDRLYSAYHLLKTGEISFNKEYEEAQRLVKVAARDCIPPEEGSFVAFQASTGVEVCTFRLLLKNAASLLDDGDPIKIKADAAFNDLIRSFVILDGLVANGEPGGASNSEKLEGAFTNTIVALDNFETSIRDCLGI